MCVQAMATFGSAMPRFARGPLCVSHNAHTGKGVRAKPLSYARQMVQDLVHYVEESTAIRTSEANQTLSPSPLRPTFHDLEAGRALTTYTSETPRPAPQAASPCWDRLSQSPAYGWPSAAPDS